MGQPLTKENWEKMIKGAKSDAIQVGEDDLKLDRKEMEKASDEKLADMLTEAYDSLYEKQSGKKEETKEEPEIGKPETSEPPGGGEKTVSKEKEEKKVEKKEKAVSRTAIANGVINGMEVFTMADVVSKVVKGIEKSGKAVDDDQKEKINSHMSSHFITLTKKGFLEKEGAGKDAKWKRVKEVA